MSNPARGGVRVARGSAMALCCLLVALAGHVLGGGSVSSLLPLLVVGLPLAAAFVVWADRQRGGGELVVAALASQVAFHAVFVFCAGSAVTHHAPSWDVAMVAGHGVAAAAMALLLERGEAALWNLHRALRRVVVRLVRGPQVDVGPQSRQVVDVVPPRRRAGLVLASACGRRGPPPAAAA